MPLYSYRCTNKACEVYIESVVWEEYRSTFVGRDRSLCPECASIKAVRAHDKEMPIIRPDIEPGYNVSLGKFVTSRADLRKHMAIYNAASDDMIINSYPSDGRLVKEERAEMLGSDKSSFSGFDIDVEGEADYQKIRDYAKDWKKNKEVR